MTDETTPTFAANEPSLRLTITPEPTGEEAAAIVAALTVLAAAAASETTPVISGVVRTRAWPLAGRYDAHHFSPHAGPRRWSRSLAWLERS